MNRKQLFTLSSFLLLSFFAGNAFAGKTGMLNLLNLTGPRQVAMGETGVLSEADPFNLEYNPAMIAGMKNSQVGISHNSFFQDRHTNTLALIFPAAGMDFGVHIRLSSVSDLEARGENPSEEPDYLFSPNDFAGKVFAAKNITDRLQAGISLGLLLEKIDTHRAVAGVFGLGAVYRFEHGFSAHASVANLGSQFTFITDKQSTPKIVRFGADFHKKDLNISADYVNIKSSDGHIHLGGEYLLEEVLFLRLGYQTGYDNRDFSAGTGFVYNNLRIDYAFVPYDSDLGSTHRFSLTISIR
ncbi:MAG: PorV/PorQ family protein [candidate division Zixibacteria bacterium]|nr:PorV/PorQ family protein [candidate division Zixibacteria bacterium]